MAQETALRDKKIAVYAAVTTVIGVGGGLWIVSMSEKPKYLTGAVGGLFAGLIVGVILGNLIIEKEVRSGDKEV